MCAMIEAEGIAFAYPQGPDVLADVDFTLGRGEVCTVLGPNGVGKTTLLNCIGGYLVPRVGMVRVGGEEVGALDAGARAGRIGFVPQLQTDTVDLAVLDYLVLGSAMRTGLFSMPHEREYRRAEEVARQFGIESLQGKSMATLSGGERQQVEIARTLVQDADVILMDEPTNHLDYGNQIKVLKAISRLAHEDGKTIVLTTHMPDHAILLGGMTAILEEGGHLDMGPAEQMIDEERLRRIYHADVRLVDIAELNRKACLTGSLG